MVRPEDLGVLVRRHRADDTVTRGVARIKVTDEGRKLVERAMELQAEAESRLEQALDACERTRLEHLLRKLLLSVDRA